MINVKNTCCFFGHRKIIETEALKTKLYEAIENLIIKENIDTFLFGSKSEFDDLCHIVVTKLKGKYSYIKRIYIRAEFPNIDDSYKKYLLERYEDTCYPKGMERAGKAAYVERNRKMIDNSNICVVYYNESYTPPRRRISRRDLTDYQPKSGTKIAYDYAVKNGKKILNFFL